MTAGVVPIKKVSFILNMTKTKTQWDLSRTTQYPTVHNCWSSKQNLIKGRVSNPEDEFS